MTEKSQLQVDISEKREMKYQYHNTKTGGIHTVTAKQFDQIKKFYKLEKYKTIWRNKRCDIFAWEAESEE